MGLTAWTEKALEFAGRMVLGSYPVPPEQLSDRPLFSASGGAPSPQRRETTVASALGFDPDRPPLPGSLSMGSGQVPEGYYSEAPPVRQDFLIGENRRISPRSGELATFQTLKAMGRLEPTMAGAISYRCQEVKSRRLVVRMKNREVDPEAPGNASRIALLLAWLEQPDRLWAQRGKLRPWLAAAVRMILELDALPIVIIRDRGGMPHSWVIVDGAIVKPLVDDFGNVPAEGAAYTIVLRKGTVWAKYSQSQMRYYVNEPLGDSLYGYPPTQRALTLIVNRILDLARSNRWKSQGAVTPVLIQMPANWTHAKSKEFTNLVNQQIRSASQDVIECIPIPADAKPMPLDAPVFDLSKDEAYKREIAWIMQISPTLLVSDNNFATAKSSAEASEGDAGAGALFSYLSDILTDLVQISFGWDDIEVLFEDKRRPFETAQSEADSKDAESGILTIDEIRERRGLQPDERLQSLQMARLEAKASPTLPFGDGGGEAPRVSPAAAPTDGIALPADSTEKAIVAELEQWKRKTVRCLESGAPIPGFRTIQIPDELAADIREALPHAPSPEAAARLFETVKSATGLSARRQRMRDTAPAIRAAADRLLDAERRHSGIVEEAMRIFRAEAAARAAGASDADRRQPSG